MCIEHYPIHQTLDNRTRGRNGHFVQQGGRRFQCQFANVFVSLQHNGNVEVFAADKGNMQQVFSQWLVKGKTTLRVGQHTGNIGTVFCLLQQHIRHLYRLAVLVLHTTGKPVSLGGKESGHTCQGHPYHHFFSNVVQ